MRTRLLVTRLVRILAVPLLVAGVAAGAAPAPPTAAARARSQVPAVSTPFFGQFNGVAATSASNAWAVGYGNTAGETLIEHWNGTAWKWAPTPTLASDFYSVAATSASNAWAVGYTAGQTAATLIAHWNGTSWTQVPSPSPG